MAKKKPQIDVFGRTESTDSAAADPITARGVGLKKSEWDEIDQLANELNMTPHKLAVMLLRYGVDHLKTGKIKTKTEKTTTLDL